MNECKNILSRHTLTVIYLVETFLFQAHGLCFSVQKGIAVPPSLKNMYKELATDIQGFTPPNHGNLEKWAKQGILLLNATLTVE